MRWLKVRRPTDGEVAYWIHGAHEFSLFGSSPVLRGPVSGAGLAAPESSRDVPSCASRLLTIYQNGYILDAIVILDVFSKKSRATPEAVIRACRDRLLRYARVRGGGP